MDNGQEVQADNEKAITSSWIVMLNLNLSGRLFCLLVANIVKLIRKLTLKETLNAMDCNKDCRSKNYNIFGFPKNKKNAKVKKTCHTQQSDGCVIKKKGASLWFTSNPRKQKPRAGGLQA